MSISMSKHAALCPQVLYMSEYNFLRLSGKDEVTSDKEIFRPDMRQKTFFEISQTSRVCVALKTIWSYFTLTNIKLR